MMHFRYFVAATFAFAFVARSTTAWAAPGDGFALSDVYSLRPDGVCQEITGGSLGRLAQKNGHWDAATKTVKLAAARNEEAAIQFVIPRGGKAFGGRMSDLRGPGIIAAIRATFSALVWVKDANGILQPDLVVPLDGTVGDIRTFDIPTAFEGLPKAQNTIGTMLIEIWVPTVTPAGLYRGTLAVLAGGTEIETLNIELTVLDLTLPDVPNFAFDLLEYGMPAEGLGLQGKLNNDGLGKQAEAVSPEFKAANYQIYKLAADNRCFINALPYSSQRGSPRFAPPIAGKGAAAMVMSWKEYDGLFTPILDGRCNKFGQPPAHFTLPFNVNYPHLCESEPKKQFDWLPFANSLPPRPGVVAELKEFEETNRAVAQEFVRHFAERGWTRTCFEMYHNQKASPDRNRIPWKLDEPVEELDYRALGYLFNTAHWAFEGAAANNVRVVTRLDIGHFHCDKLLTPEGKPTKDYKAKQFDSHDAPRYLKDTTDHWVIGITHAEGAQHVLKNYEGPGRKLMVYGTAGDHALDQHYGQFAGECVRWARMGIVGRVVYKLDLASGNPNNAGSNYVLYNGKSSLGFDGALASRRLKLWRDSVNLFDYITAARQRDGAAVDALLMKMVRVGPSADEQYREQSRSRGYWVNNNVEDYAVFKLKLAEIATGTKITTGDFEGFSDAFRPCGSADRIVRYD
jgi:hypothetical protein